MPRATRRVLYVACAALTTALFLHAAPAAAGTEGLTLPESGDNQRAVVSQWIGPVEITITYHSPQVTSPTGEDRHGKIWGDLVPYGYTSSTFGTCGDKCPWRGGANENTLFTTSHAVNIEGQPLPAGTYGLHFLPGKEEWVVIFSHDHKSWGSFFYDEHHDALRVKVKAVPHPYQHWLAYEFPLRAPDHATAQVAWEDLAVPFKISVHDINALYIAGIREDLTNQTGFRNDNWVLAAQFSLVHNVDLAEGLSWAQQAVSSPSFGIEDFTNLILLAGLQDANGKSAEAEQTRQKAYHHQTATATVLHAYARGKLTRGETEGAIKVFFLNAQRYPDQWPVHAGLMRAYSAQGKFPQALAEARLALKQAPDELNRKALLAMIDKLQKNQDIN